VFFKLTLLFTTVTLLELSILIPVGKSIGLFATLALVIGTAALGGALAKRQGAAIWNRIQDELQQGEMPGDSLLDGLAVLIAGTLLLTPGVLTDIAGILLLIPICRRPVKALVKKYARGKMEGSSVTQIRGGMSAQDVGPSARDVGPSSDTTRGRRGPTQRDDVIDVEPSETDEEPDDEVLEAVPEYQSSKE
jgi:UPF0716 protein FxsA